MTDTSLITASSAERHPQVRTDLPEGLDDRSLFSPEVAAKLQSLWLDHVVSSRRTTSAQFQAVFSLKLLPSVPISNSPRCVQPRPNTNFGKAAR